MSRNITNTPTKIFVNTVSAREPLELLTPSNTSSTMTLKGLNGFTANKFIKVNSAGNALEYADDNNTTYGATAPIVLVGSDFTYDISGLSDATLALTDNLFIQQGTNLKKTTLTAIKTLINPTIPANTIANGKTGLTSFTQGDILYYNTGTALSKLSIGTTGQVLKVSSGGIIEWGTDNDTTYTVASPLQKNSSNQISINQDGFNLTTSITANDEILFFDTSDNFDKITFSNFKTAVNYGATAPISLVGSNYTYDISSLADATLALTDNLFIQQGANLKKTTLTAIKTLISPTIPANTISNGKTGLTTYTKGDILYYNTGTALSKLSIGSVGKSLIVSATGIPMWGNAVVNTNAPISTNGITDNIELDFTNLTESDINDNDYLLLNLSTNSTSFYKKKYYTFRNSIALPVNLPLKKVSVGGQNEDELSFTISQLGASNGSLTSTVIIAEGGNDASFRQLNLSQLGDVVIPAGVNFGTSTSIAANHRTFGANSRFLNLNGSQINFKINGTTKMSYVNDIFTIEPVNTAELRVAHTTDTNAMTNVDTECCISSIKDLHLFTPGTNFANSKNRIVFIAGGSQALVGIFGYCGNNTSVANGGIPNPANSNNPMGSNFIMTQGNDNTFAVCNRVSNSFSTTFTQFTIKNQDTNFWTENVIINGNVGQAVLKLNSSGGVLVGQNGRSYVGRDTSTGFIYLGNAVDNSELFSALTYAKGIEFSRVLKGTKTDTSFGSSTSAMTAFPPIGQQLFQTSTSVGQGYLVNTVYRVPNSSTERYWSCWQVQLTGSHYILGWGTHYASGSSGAFSQIFYVRSDGAYFGAGSLVTSDRRIKKDIINADGEECINILKSIKLKKYRYNDDWAEKAIQ